MKKTNFYVVRNLREYNESGLYLLYDNWDDYGFKTRFTLYYKDSNNKDIQLGSLKIGYNIDCPTGRTFDILPKQFTILSDDFYSVGLDVNYYKKLHKFNSAIFNDNSQSIFESLNDIAYNNELFFKNQDKTVLKTSLLRFLTPHTILNQFNRVANGGVVLTEYDFSFFYKTEPKEIKMNFNIDPFSFINTNIHAIIGENGSGKTHLIKEMIGSLIPDYNNSEFINYPESSSMEINKLPFSKVLVISYSVFDKIGILYKNKFSFNYYVFWGYDEDNVPLDEYFTENFSESLKQITKIQSKKEMWIKAIQILKIDAYSSYQNIENLKYATYQSDSDMEEAKERFSTLSTGHKIILSTITKIIEISQEQTFIIIDEPEAHLHPELLTNYIKALSFILKEINGAAFVATHSPIVIREIPKKNCYIITRYDNDIKLERPKIETYGANINSITNEVFGLQYNSSSYFKQLNKTLEEKMELNEEELLVLGDEALSYYQILRQRNVKEN